VELLHNYVLTCDKARDGLYAACAR